MVEGVISEIITHKAGFRPLKVNFQNGKIRAGEESKLISAVYRNKQKQTIVAAATNDILYTGQVNRDDELYNNFLVLHHKKTGKVQLVAYDTVTLTPQVYAKDITSNSKTTVQDLNKTFGSRKIKRMTEQRENWKMDVSVIKDELEKTIAAVNVDESDLLQAKVDENDNIYRPRINRDASTKEQVYDLNSMIPAHILSTLDEEANSVLKDDLDGFDFLPYVKSQLRHLQDAVVANQHNKCKLLLLVHYLSQYLLKPARLVSNRLKICESSQEVNQYIIDNFSLASSTGRSRPLSMKDKVICYILVLAMMALDYQIDVEAFSPDLKIGVKKLQDMGRVLAFTQQGKNKNILILKVPLPAVVSFSPGKRKR